jgi:pimeloyl-ACP methyl ester carboxylesterase
MDTLGLADGRQAQFWLGGADHGPVVLFFHGTPDTRWAARFGEHAAVTVGVRLLCVNRPGYGRSTREASTYSSVADDAACVLDLLGIDDVAALGMSVGGGYAAAFASQHRERTRALGIVATLPMDGTASESVEAAMEHARPEFESWAAGIDAEDADDAALATRWAQSLPEQDAAIVRHLPVAAVAASAREALADHYGFLRDAALLHQPREVDVEAITCPTHLWYGGADERAMPGATWFAERIPQAALVVRPDTTHLATLAAHWTDILSTLIEADLA